MRREEPRYPPHPTEQTARQGTADNLQHRFLGVLGWIDIRGIGRGSGSTEGESGETERCSNRIPEAGLGRHSL